MNERLFHVKQSLRVKALLGKRDLRNSAQFVPHYEAEAVPLIAEVLLADTY